MLLPHALRLLLVPPPRFQGTILASLLDSPYLADDRYLLRLCEMVSLLARRANRAAEPLQPRSHRSFKITRGVLAMSFGDMHLDDHIRAFSTRTMDKTHLAWFFPRQNWSQSDSIGSCDPSDVPCASPEAGHVREGGQRIAAFYKHHAEHVRPRRRTLRRHIRATLFVTACRSGKEYVRLSSTLLGCLGCRGWRRKSYERSL